MQADLVVARMQQSAAGSCSLDGAAAVADGY
jgi:hypothetical protein